MTRQGRFRQQGISMIEVLIALLITASGLLGFAALQARALESTESAYARSQAAALAQEMVERVQSSLGGMPVERKEDVRAAAVTALMTSYTSANDWKTATANCTTADCTEAQMRAYDMQQIRTIASRVLPNGTAVMGWCSAAADQLCAYVGWGASSADTCMAAGGTGDSCVAVPGPRP